MQCWMPSPWPFFGLAKGGWGRRCACLAGDGFGGRGPGLANAANGGVSAIIPHENAKTAAGFAAGEKGKNFFHGSR